jgi:hypothetical protein
LFSFFESSRQALDGLPTKRPRRLRYHAASEEQRHGTGLARSKTKKADVAEHPKVFDHVGLLSNEPPGMAGLLSI